MRASKLLSATLTLWLSAITVQGFPTSSQGKGMRPMGINAGNVVTNTLDSGNGSLRSAIAFCNQMGVKNIHFNISKVDSGFANGYFTINITSNLPAITVDGLLFDGASQTKFTGDTNPNGPEIYIKGAGTAGLEGIAFNAVGDQIGDVAVGGFPSRGIYFLQGGGLVQRCYVGVAPDGTTASPNGTGISIYQAPNTSVGGTRANGNLVSGNVYTGIYIDMSPGCSVLGNYIGTDRTGDVALPNTGYGVEILNDCTGTRVGSANTGEGNVISGNSKDGISLFGGKGVTIKGNKVGPNKAGTASMGNGAAGISADLAPNTTIGGTTAADRNLVSGNKGPGISFGGFSTPSTGQIAGNYIGVDASGLLALPNNSGVDIGSQAYLVLGTNLISGNTGAGVNISQLSKGSVRIYGNLIGCDSTGLKALPNSQGIAIQQSVAPITIGGVAPGQSNLISGNLFQGIDSSISSVSIVGNWIGVDKKAQSALPNGSGIRVYGSGAITIGSTLSGGGNVIAGNKGEGIRLEGTHGCVVKNNRIGVTPTGLPIGNLSDGILIALDATNNVIGGPGDGGRNVISGNGGAGVTLDGSISPDISFAIPLRPSSNTIASNFIGLDPTASSAVPNQVGIKIRGGANHNTIGGMTANDGNVISGNTTFGVFCGDLGTDYNTFNGNIIGSDLTGAAFLPNSIGFVIANGAKSNLVGNSLGNLIAFNTYYGLRLAGASTSGNGALNNRFERNKAGQVVVDSGASGNGVYRNTFRTNVGQAAIVVKDATSVGNNLRGNTFDVGNRLLVDLVGNDDAYCNTPNDTLDADPGPNNLQNNANINTATFKAGTVSFTGTMPGAANTAYLVDVYLVDVPNIQRHGGKLRLLMSIPVTTNGSGIASFAKSISVSGTPVGLCTQVYRGNGDTSEFSLNRLF